MYRQPTLRLEAHHGGGREALRNRRDPERAGLIEMRRAAAVGAAENDGVVIGDEHDARESTIDQRANYSFEGSRFYFRPGLRRRPRRCQRAEDRQGKSSHAISKTDQRLTQVLVEERQGALPGELRGRFVVARR